MSISHKLNLALSMEDDAPNVQVNIDTDEGGMPLDDVVATDDGAFEPTPEADAAEITERAEEIAEDNDDIEDLEVASESLIATYEAMALAQRNGGLTREAATFAAISVESVMGRYNVSHTDLGIALESFSDNKARATTISMEGISDALRNLWDAIVRKFKEMVKKIVDFYQKTVAAAPRIKRRAQGIRKKADNTTGSAEDTTVKTGLFGQLNIKGRVPEASDVINGLKNARTDFVKHKKKSSLKDELKELFNIDSFDGNKVNEKFRKVLDDMTRDYGTKKESLPGNNALYASVAGTANDSGSWDTDSKNVASIVSNFKFGIFEDEAGVKNDKDNREKEFKVLKKEEVVAICDQVIQTMDEIINYKTQAVQGYDSAKVIEKEGGRLVDKIAKQGDGDSKGMHEGNARRYLTALGQLARKIESGNASIVRYNYQVSKASLAWCSRSLSKYRNN